MLRALGGRRQMRLDARLVQRPTNDQNLLAAAIRRDQLTEALVVLDGARRRIEAEKLPPRDVCFIVTGSQGEPRSAMSRIAMLEKRNLQPGPGDAVIFSVRVTDPTTGAST